MRAKGWTHGKLIVWILFTLPEWPGVTELLHLVGSVVAGERRSHSAVASLLEQNLGQVFCSLSLSQTDLVSIAQAEGGAQCDLIAHLDVVICESISQLTT